MKEVMITRGTLTFFIVYFLFFSQVFAQEIHVNSYYGTYDAALKTSSSPSTSLQGPVIEKWQTPTPKKAYHIGVLFPHIKDSYFNTANYAIISHARKQGLKVTLYSAGGYINFGNQRMQLKHLADIDQVDGILLTSVDYMKMDPFVEEVNQAGIPVVALINDIYAPAVRAKVFAPFYDIGYKLAEYVLEDSGSKDIKVAIFPGPESSKWALGTYQGFTSALAKLKPKEKQLTLLAPLYGDTRPDVQRLRLDTLSQPENHNIDYIIGNAVAAVEAVKYVNELHDIHQKAQILSTYITLTVYEQIKKGLIKAAPSDQTISQCKIGLDMMVRILEGEEPGKDLPFLTFPTVPLITSENIDRFSYESLFGEKDFTPVFSNFNM